MNPIRIVLADDHPVVLHGLSRFLGDRGLDVLKCCGDGSQCLAAIRELKPDCALMDVSMPNLTGLEVLTRLRTEDTRTPVVLFSAQFKPWQISRALRARVNGLVSKDADPAIFVNCIQEVTSGKTFYSPEVQARIDSSMIAAISELTDREHEVLTLVREGLSNKDIGRRLDLVEGTVKIHLHNIYRKMNVPNRTSLAMLDI